MEISNPKKQIGILGGGPAGMFMYKRLIEAGQTDLDITIIESKNQLGPGMPYSTDGASIEHITNVSDNEIPEIFSSIKEWIPTAPAELLKRFDMKPKLFNEYKVVPRLFFGEYLAAQFDLLLKAAKKAGIETRLLYNTTITDIKDEPENKKVTVYTQQGGSLIFDTVVICTGHNWPKKYEGQVPNWFDSPYPPAKLTQKINYPVAIKGSSLTAIDAVRTLAKHNGVFTTNEDGTLTYTLNEGSKNFSIAMHSLGGLLPAIRFHLEDSHLSKGSLLSDEEVKESRAANGGFIPLNFIFENNFKKPLRQQNPQFYDEISHMTLEDFVAHMMSLRERLDAFVLLKAEFAEAEKSIKRRQSVHWKEMLAVLSYTMNYPAKYLSAEDMLRLKKVLMPLISIVIAFVPQSSCRELLALHAAGVLSLVSVDRESTIEPATNGGAIYSYATDDGSQQSISYKMFINAVGQPPFMYNDFPFESLRKGGSVSEALLKFKLNEEGNKEMEAGNKQVVRDSQGDYYLQVPGININDNFGILDKYGAFNDRIYIMAVPYIGGLNPDYSGLDFCEAASARIIKALLPVAISPQKEVV